MSASNSTVKAAAALSEANITAAPLRGALAVYADLFKARLTTLALLTTLTGFYVGSRAPADFVLMFHTILGTAMIASGGAAFNQLLERVHDARMSRTRQRPLPAGELTPRKVFWVAGALSLCGVLYLAMLVNWLSAALGFASWFLYVLVYTPMKRVSWLNTAVGAVPGGLPPLVGWAGARGEIGLDGLSLFAILAFWQVPHFLAIAWLYRDEYAKAGYVMLPAVDPSGRRTSNQALLTGVMLLALSVCPSILGITGITYGVGAVLLGVAFVWLCLRFRRLLDLRSARHLFLASILYLPLLLGVMVWDKV